MKKLGFVFALMLLLGAVVPVEAVDFSFHGDMNNRFLIYTNRQDWLNNEQDGVIEDSTVEAYYAELKYRYWFEAADDEDKIKGVYAIEVGGIRYGEQGQGGGFSGDGVNLETRWAYLDFQTPGIERKARWRMGLSPWNVNSFFWQETATGLTLYGDAGDMMDYQVAWIRPTDKLATNSDDDDLDDLDILYGRLNFKPQDKLKVALFGLYFHSHEEDADTVGPRDWLVKQFDDIASFDFWTVGVDGSWTPGNFFLNWDLLYQGGDIKNVIWDPNDQAGDTFDPRTKTGESFDLSAWFAHADVGYKFGSHKLTYTFWYASGDDDPNDNDFDGYLAVDLDRADNISIFEGLYTDDSSYFTERPYMLDKGFIMNKLAWDYNISEKMTVGAAGMYMLTSEDIEYTNFDGDNESNDEIGFELNGYLQYMLYKNIEFKINAGYLWAGDAMDAFETGSDRDGNSDENIFGSSFRIRYKF
ncbi:MAG: hypothetical protein JRF72_06710 [Deltaproteobacteria bacterium]|nr:hypothetical protein [Deltaproteobacteria bacterium]